MNSVDVSLPIIIEYKEGAQTEKIALNSGEMTQFTLGEVVVKVYAFEEVEPIEYITNGVKKIVFGPKGDIVCQALSAILSQQGNKTEIYPLDICFVNGKKIFESTQLRGGDRIFIAGYEYTYLTNAIVINQKVNHDILLPKVGNYNSHFDDNYPDFRRSPRLIYVEPVDEMKIEMPPSQPSKPSDKLAKVIIAPFASLTTTVVMALIRANMTFVYIGIATTIIAVISAIVSYFQKKKEYKIAVKERETYYETYLIKCAQDIEQTVGEQRHSLNYHYPSLKDLNTMAQNVDSRIYERNRQHFDYLKLRIGTGIVPLSFKIGFEEHEIEMERDPLVVRAGKLKSKFVELEDAPIYIDYSLGMIGYIGKQSVVVDEIIKTLMQLSFFHSYHDVEFLTVFNELDKDRWMPLKWLPHFKISAFNLRGFVYNERSKDQIMSSMTQLLKDRKQAIEDKITEPRGFSPHYVFVIADEKLIIDHPIMEYLTDDPIDLGVTLIHVKDVIEDLNENTKTIIDIRNSKYGTILTENEKLKNKFFYLDNVDFDYETYCRALSPLNHLLRISSSIPERVSFLEMYRVEKVQELGIKRRWTQNESYKSLAVPLGLRGKDDIVQLNLHEKAHGPHGLVAGTTGSGKSEIVQSYILSLAVNFHPYEVAFLLIDYKGGGMANLFKDLPHHLGSITNLDGSQSMRALISIKAELQRRQRLFSEFEVNHINQYQKLFKENPKMVPMPHLFLISDEFAELKSEQPEFMKELVSTARIGRSLGIHLILATQKPSGVVDDQIWSNSRFKLCLKVADVADSKEMLKTPDAANITLPGRSYLQVGNNEIYELFQSAYSGSDYTENKEDVIKDNRIYSINELGQYEVLTRDLSGLSNKKDIKKSITELDAVIAEVRKISVEENIKPLPEPWLPPLESKIFTQDLGALNFKDCWKETMDLKVPFAYKDQPHIQSQSLHELDFASNGHMVVFGSPGFGKSTALQTIVMNATRLQSPELLNVYLFDFGTNGLLPLRYLPHVADLFTISETEKVMKWILRISKEVSLRKKKLSDVGVANMSQYRRATKESFPNIMVVIDNYDAVRESSFQEQLDAILTQLSRDGASLGIHLVFSAARSSSIRYQIGSNFKMQATLFMIDATEVSSIVGRSEFKIEEIEGRILMKLEEPTVMQILLPERGEDELEMYQALREESNQMSEHYTGERPLPIPMMPEVLNEAFFYEQKTVKETLSNPHLIALGLDYQNVEASTMDISQNIYYLGNNQNQLNNRLRMLLTTLNKQKDVQTTLLDIESRPLIVNQDLFKNYRDTAEGHERVVRDLHGIMKQREKELGEYYASGDIEGARKYLESQNEIYVSINNIFKISEGIQKGAQVMLLELLENQGRLKICFLVFYDLSGITSSYGEIQKYLKRVEKVLIEMKISDQNAYTSNSRSYKEPQLSQNDCYILDNGNETKIRFIEM
ncbi:MAG: type VII secretion protein EssC [Erysipelothrix sp.]